jgi:hypothetical protein
MLDRLVRAVFAILALCVVHSTLIVAKTVGRPTTIISHNHGKRMPEEQQLIAHLLSNYDMATRPVFNASDATEVRFGMSYIQICDMVCHQYC